MSKLEVFQNGVFSNTGEPVFQIGVKKEDGTYDVTVFDLMSKKEAEARLHELQPAAPKAKKKVTSKKEQEVKVPSKSDLSQMTKVELEEEMRHHGLELDRRKNKVDLVKDSVAFLNGK